MTRCSCWTSSLNVWWKNDMLPWGTKQTYMERYNHNGVGANPVGITYRTAKRRRACLWSVDVGGDQTDTSRGNLRLNLNWMVMSLHELVLERAIHLFAVQNFQSERLIELCVLEADKASACVFHPTGMEVKIRNAAAGHEGDPGDPGDDSIEGRGTDDDDAAVFAVCCCLLPTTPLCYINPGPSICDSHRLTMALSVALNSFDSYSQSSELKSTSGMKPGAYIASLVDRRLELSNTYAYVFRFFFAIGMVCPSCSIRNWKWAVTLENPHVQDPH